MRTLKTLTSALALILMFAFSANAQTAVSATAEVLQDVAYSVDNNVDFGNFTSSFTAATIDPTTTTGDTGVNGTAGTDYNAGRITINGAGTNDVIVTLDNASILLANSTNGTSADELSLSVSLSQATDDVNTDRGGASFTSGGTISLTGGLATVWIGGDLSANDDGDGSIDAGTYENTADLTFTIEYSL